MQTTYGQEASDMLEHHDGQDAHRRWQIDQRVGRLEEERQIGAPPRHQADDGKTALLIIGEVLTAVLRGLDF